MNRTEVWRFGGRILRQKSTGILLLFWAAGFSCLYGAILCGKRLAEDWSHSTEIFCEISENPENQLESLRKAEGVECLSQWMESAEILEWKGYQANVRFTGVEQTYLEERFPEAIGSRLSENMPSIWVEEPVFSAMKNSRKEALPEREASELLYQTVTVNGVNVRIYGIIPRESVKTEEMEEDALKEDESKDNELEEDQLEKDEPKEETVYHVYTTVEAYKDVLFAENSGSAAQNFQYSLGSYSEVGVGSEVGSGSVAETGSWGAEVGSGSGSGSVSGTGSGAGTGSVSGIGSWTGTGESAGTYYIELKNVGALKAVRSILEQNQSLIQNQEELEEKEEQLDLLKREIRLELLLSAGALICAGLLLWMQGKLWQKNHEPLIRYLYSLEGGKAAWKKISRSRVTICLTIGAILGVILQWAAALFTL